MSLEKIIDLCYKINEDIKNSEEYINYKKYEDICLTKHLNLFNKYKEAQDNYFNYKDFLSETQIKEYKDKYIEIKKQLFEIEDVKNYFYYKQLVESQISEINYKISKSINDDVKYLNEFGVISGGKCE